jgi:uncharacterized membrane protein YdjX (TVP38/TMEM64 family)
MARDATNQHFASIYSHHAQKRAVLRPTAGHAANATKPYKRLILVATFLALLAMGFQVAGLRDNFNLEYLHRCFEQNRASGVLIFIALFALGNLIQIPEWLFLAAAVLALGEVWGGVATYLAALVSCTITFVVIRLVGGDALGQVKGRWANALLQKLNDYPVAYVAMLRLMLQTMPALSYALALSGLRLRQYLLGTAVGLPLPIALYCVFF